MTSRSRNSEWFDQDAFWRETYPFMFGPARFAGTEHELETLLALTSPNGKSVLDLCCGPGRFSVALAKRNFTVTGVDRSAFLLQKAKSLARQEKVKVEWVEADMRDFKRLKTYDLVLSMYTSFGYFDKKSEDDRVLQNIFTSLNPGGSLIMDLMGKEVLARILLPSRVERLSDNHFIAQQCEVFDDWSRVRNVWSVVRKGKTSTFKFHHTVYSGQELRMRLEQAGFRGVQLYGTLDGGAYDHTAQRLIAVARKPAIKANKAQRT
ncbi:MAG: class I SAM-dependent methyltransferase [Candidatus Sumerlaeaceae bacterium]